VIVQLTFVPSVSFSRPKEISRRPSGVLRVKLTLSAIGSAGGMVPVGGVVPDTGGVGDAGVAPDPGFEPDVFPILLLLGGTQIARWRIIATFGNMQQTITFCSFFVTKVLSVSNGKAGFIGCRKRE
jgi:hypothetical protein